MDTPLNTTLHTTTAQPHLPVMLEEVLHALSPRDGGVYVDGTFGAGGYTRAILDAADCTVYAIDRDPSAIVTAEAMAKDYGGRLRVCAGRFGDMQGLLAGAGAGRVDGVVLDIGVSSMQLDTPVRGFSFRHDGPLDMRMDMAGPSAADIVNTAAEAELADILYTYGEERAARRIAKRIVAARAAAPVLTTFQLRDLIHDVLPMHGGMKTDTATRSFQALRIFVNDELGELSAALDAAAEVLAPMGRLVVVTFHSLEDSLVKAFLRKAAGREPAGSRHSPVPADVAPAIFALEKNGAVKPSDAEIARNPRARSARLRYAIRREDGGADA